MNRLLNFLLVWAVMTILGFVFALTLGAIGLGFGIVFPGTLILAVLLGFCCAFPFAIDPQYNLWKRAGKHE